MMWDPCKAHARAHTHTLTCQVSASDFYSRNMSAGGEEVEHVSLPGIVMYNSVRKTVWSNVIQGQTSVQYDTLSL